ncbi:MAG TPA: GNAT family N-acetyltransferase [Anaerolineales bacterium]|nr:GNAT family N-acetyltransferase [Anaerolineales bacterium]
MAEIRPIRTEEIPLLKDFAPPDWNNDTSALFAFHFGMDYFHPLVAELDGKVVGCAEGIVNGNAGWLGNIIVLAEARRQGIGQALTARLVELFHAHGCAHQILIATQMGEPVYARLGFRVSSHYIFLKRATPSAPKPASGVRPFVPGDAARLFALDRRISSEDRRPLLERFLVDAHVHAAASGALDGFFLPGLGNGLVLAENAPAGLALLQFKLGQGITSLVVPEGNTAALNFLFDQGFLETARAPRMALGPDVDWQPACVYSRGAGYCG